MNNATIKQILIGKGITQLYHANSMVTACTFLENGGLLSRGCVEDRKLNQTDQQSDQKDKDVDVFYDIFLILWTFTKEVGASIATARLRLSMT